MKIAYFVQFFKSGTTYNFKHNLLFVLLLYYMYCRTIQDNDVQPFFFGSDIINILSSVCHQ